MTKDYQITSPLVVNSLGNRKKCAHDDLTELSRWQCERPDLFHASLANQRFLI